VREGFLRFPVLEVLRTFGSPWFQAEHVFTSLNRVLAQARTSLEQAVESQLYEPDLSTFYDVDSVWARYMPVPEIAIRVLSSLADQENATGMVGGGT
jgi:hypothetical protein